MDKNTTRTLWKGAITFGLVHIPIALHAATSEHALNFDWLDKRSMDPVGYKRINKKTGEEMDKENIIKGIEYEEGQYIILTPEEIAAAYPVSTQTIEIEAFVPVADIPFIFLDRPYYVSPINKGEKVYALLREILKKNGNAAIAKVVIQTKQHLAALIPLGPVLVLNLLRWEDEIRPFNELNLPSENLKATGLTDKEIKMGERLVEDMSTKWKPQLFKDSFKQQIQELVQKKIKAGKTKTVTPIEPMETTGAGAQIYDLTEMLQRSLDRGSKTESVPRAKQVSPKTKSPPAAKKVTKAKAA